MIPLKSVYKKTPKLYNNKPKYIFIYTALIH